LVRVGLAALASRPPNVWWVESGRSGSWALVNFAQHGLARVR